VNTTTTLEAIEIWIWPHHSFRTNYGMQLYDGEGTGGPLIATSPTTVTLNPELGGGTPPGFHSYSFVGLNITLQPNHAYTLRMVSLDNPQIWVGFSLCNNPYPDGIEYMRGSIPYPDYDVSFKLYGSDPSYQGCYTDDWNRALPAYFGDLFTRETCIAAAAAAGYSYAGLQYFGQCFAGNQLGYTQVADSECGLPCDADPTQTCGGGFRNQIYSTAP
jgi:hypothetical protein